MTVIFKLGGSLLTLPGLADKLRAIVDERPDHQRLLVPGGGAAADVVREWSLIHRLDDEASHWIAISSSDLNRKFLSRLLGWKSANSRLLAEQLWNCDASPLLLNMTEFLLAEEVAAADSLPHDWNVTSDSLAAWAAIRWPADELVLLKSVPAPSGLSAIEASQNQLVDAHFPLISGQLRRISWCNLRSSLAVIEPWLTNSIENSRTTP